MRKKRETLGKHTKFGRLEETVCCFFIVQSKKLSIPGQKEKRKKSDRELESLNSRNFIIYSFHTTPGWNGINTMRTYTVRDSLLNSLVLIFIRKEKYPPSISMGSTTL